MDELEDIEAKAFDFGKLVRGSETAGNETSRFVKARHDWVAFRDNLPMGVKAIAQTAFDRGHNSERTSNGNQEAEARSRHQEA